MGFRRTSTYQPVVRYRMGQPFVRRRWYTKQTGWFGKVTALSLAAGLLMLTQGMSSILSETIDTQYAKAVEHTTAQTSALAPQEIVAADNIINLQPVLNDWAATHKGQRWSVVVKSLDGPEFESSLNAQSQFESASIYKLFLTLPLMNQIPFERQKQISVDAGGTRRTIAECVDMMIRLSDNNCGVALGYYLNWSKATESLRRGGFTQTDFVSHKNILLTSAGDTAKFLEALNGDMFNGPQQDFVLSSMSKQIYRSGIPAGCPGCKVADKVGFLESVTHDAGIVNYSRGKYVLVIFSDQAGAFQKVAELTGKIQQEISQTAR